MKLCTMPKGSLDGRLDVVSRDLTRGAASVAALDDWQNAEPRLRPEFEAVERGGGDVIDLARSLAPLPWAWQWLDRSVYTAPDAKGMSNRFLAACEDVLLLPAEDGIRL